MNLAGKPLGSVYFRKRKPLQGSPLMYWLRQMLQQQGSIVVFTKQNQTEFTLTPVY